MIPRRCPEALGSLRLSLAVVLRTVIPVVGRRWWRRMVIVAVVVVRLRRWLGSRLLDGLYDGGMAAGERQQGYGAE